ncbi:MAG: class I SAM-dependent methyltransferase [Clostridia bacterium]|nr:class I SAM-dependent methyltransferase [Clostridia bacterium]
MSRLGWINEADYSFACVLMFERFQLDWMLGTEDPALRRALGVALKRHPDVAWYCAHKCPERAENVAALLADAPEADEAAGRAAEIEALGAFDDFVIYTTPEKMAANCPFIYGWDKARLFEMADFAGKTVLDVGSGSGRLAFAAAERAAWVYASEPVDTLREFLRSEIARRGLGNMRVCDGMAHALPFPDDTFDIVMSGHVVGDFPDEETAELARVAKKGGWLLDCPGDQPNDPGKNWALLDRGWEEMAYTGSFGYPVHRFRKLNDK